MRIYASIIAFTLLGPWDPNPFRVECSSNLQQKFTKLAEYCPHNEPGILGNIELEHFHQKLHFHNWFKRNHLRQHVRNDCGIISYFHTNSSLGFLVESKSQLYNKHRTRIAVILHERFIPLWRTDMWGLWFSQNIQWQASSFLIIYNLCWHLICLRSTQPRNRNSLAILESQLPPRETYWCYALSRGAGNEYKLQNPREL